MGRVEAAAADRLPWLPDEPQPRRAKRRGSAVLPWILVATVAAAGAGFWLGTESLQIQPAPSRKVAPSTTVQLPKAEPAAEPVVRLPAQPEIKTARAPEVRPTQAREVHIVAPLEPRPAAPSQKTSDIPASPQPATTDSTVPASVQPAVPTLWNPRIANGAAGRLVQIGAFGTTQQAKRGWSYMVRAYPALSHLPALVRPTRNSKGRVFYRFQIGTTSQAHSEVLCQRMERISFSCAVVGLPWKAKVER